MFISPYKLLRENISLLSYVHNFSEVHEIRWLSIYEAIDTVVRTLDSLLTYTAESESKDPKAKGLRIKVASELFITIAHAMLDILRPVMALTLTLQKKNLDIGTVKVLYKIEKIQFYSSHEHHINYSTYEHMIMFN